MSGVLGDPMESIAISTEKGTGEYRTAMDNWLYLRGCISKTGPFVQSEPQTNPVD